MFVWAGKRRRILFGNLLFSHSRAELQPQGKGETSYTTSDTNYRWCVSRWAVCQQVRAGQCNQVPGHSLNAEHINMWAIWMFPGDTGRVRLNMLKLIWQPSPVFVGGCWVCVPRDRKTGFTRCFHRRDYKDFVFTQGIMSKQDSQLKALKRKCDGQPGKKLLENELLCIIVCNWREWWERSVCRAGRRGKTWN